MEAASAFRDTLVAYTRTNSNSEQAAASAKYMRNLFPFLGIRTPLRKEILKLYKPAFKQLNGQEQRLVITRLWQEKEREFQYMALDLFAFLTLNEADIELIKQLILDKSWWDSADGLDNFVAKYFLTFPQTRAQITYEWQKERNIWLTRCLIDHQLGFKQNTDWDYLKSMALENKEWDEFFVQSAIGWSLAEYSKYQPEIVIGFLENTRPLPFARRRGLEWVKKKTL